MSDITIRFEGVSKKYRLHREWLSSIRDEAAKLAQRVFGGTRNDPEGFWALKDVSFDVRRGETVGLIGANGAGKSTILKILSRITVPTSGRFSLSGSVGALIEVGAGFHPDLTGRENVFLSGAIRGMRRSEIAAKFDRIVDFAEVEKFIDTPIKYYSSGMLVRLGFAVAAHIDPDILLVDEVLSVGDAAFQVKCHNKIVELKQQAKTIVLVSHHMTHILQQSHRVLWIDHGTIRGNGDPESVVDEYLATVREATLPAAPQPAPEGGKPIRITKVRVLDPEGIPTDLVEYGHPATIEIEYEVSGLVSDPVIGVTVRNIQGLMAAGLTSRLGGIKLDTSRPCGVVRLTLTPLIFTRGAYTVTVAVHDEHIQRYLDLRDQAATFMVEGPGVASREVRGTVVCPHRWDVETRD